MLFLPHFFSFAGHLVDFILVGKFFGKAFRIVGLDEREGRLRWVVKKDFHGNFWVNVTWFLPFSLVSLTESCSFWYGLKDLFTLHKLADESCLGPLKLMMSQVIKKKWICTGGYGQFRGE